jgi:hypothetical protein
MKNNVKGAGMSIRVIVDESVPEKPHVIDY